MRLLTVERPVRWKDRLKLGLLRLVGRREPPDVVKTLLHRPELFGTAANALFQAALRGPSEWTIAEREFMAAYVSHLNRCLF